ncbi:MAG: RNase adapter RapZ [Clostridia bacterium]|nr:RNase adapter RapZ [Clostridia bacterium]
MRFVIITGISGAGKSHTIKYMEDLGFFCIDNLPPELIPKFADICKRSADKMDKIALVVDIRGGELLKELLPALDEVNGLGVSYEILFLDAGDEVLIKRYKESRRAHPLAPEGRLIRGIKEERRILENIKGHANHIIDTSNLTPKLLKEQLTQIFVEGKVFDGLIISVTSFGFKYGIPLDCDLVFDVRFLPNPYYIDSMRKLTGKNETVREYVLKYKETQVFLEKLNDMLEFLIPNYIKEGKSQLVIGIGCTGGKHRSVTIADSIYSSLASKGHRVIADHRDIEKDNRGAVK